MSVAVGESDRANCNTAVTRLDHEDVLGLRSTVSADGETKSDAGGATLPEDAGGAALPQDACEAQETDGKASLTHSLLSDRAILEHMRRGTVVIRPFMRENLSTSSYDVTLGTSYYRETPPESGSSTLYNPFSRAMVERVWGRVCTAERADEWTARAAVAPLENIASDDRVIVLAPGETILAHTNEFIGGRDTVVQMMKARSSLGRNFIEVCKCAGTPHTPHTS